MCLPFGLIYVPIVLPFTHVPRMKNPHLRAKLAEVLEAVMPHMEPASAGSAQPVMFQRQRVFCSYRHAPHLAEALIAVFVDIEFTGGFSVCVRHMCVFVRARI